MRLFNDFLSGVISVGALVPMSICLYQAFVSLSDFQPRELVFLLVMWIVILVALIIGLVTYLGHLVNEDSERMQKEEQEWAEKYDPPIRP